MKLRLYRVPMLSKYWIPSRWDIFGILALAAVYFIFARLGLSLAVTTPQVTAVWPPTGIALAALILFGFRFWPGIALGALAVNMLVDEPIPVALGIAVGNTLEAVVGAYLVRRFSGPYITFERVHHFVVLAVFAAIPSTLISATIGVTSLALGALIPWGQFLDVWTVWWLGDLMGALIFAPLFLTFYQLLEADWSGKKTIERVSLLALVGLVLSLSFTDLIFPRSSELPFIFLLFPLTLWSASRFKPLMTALIIAQGAVFAVWGTLHGIGPFSFFENIEADLLALQYFLAACGLSGMTLAAAVAERKNALEHVKLQAETLQGATIRLEKELALRERFVAVFSHEFRNPLAPIGTAIELLLANKKDPESLALVQMMQRQFVHLTRLLNDLLDTSRIQRGEIQLQRKEVSIGVVIQNAIETAQSFIRERRHNLSIMLPEEDTVVFGDPMRLEQIFTNILRNSAKFTPPGGMISLTVAHTPTEAVITVKDSGIGIAEDHLPNIFIFFSRSDPASPIVNEGLGVGLAIAKSITELHGGMISGRSDGAGKGSEFEIRFPRIAAPAVG